MFAVLDLPAFPLQALLRLQANPPAGPAVATEAVGHQSRVIAANVEAIEARVHIGMTAAQARARCSQLHMFSRQPQAEQTTMDLVFALLYQVTPRIEKTRPGTLTCNLKGARIDDRTLLALSLLEQIRANGMQGKFGIAPFPDLALFAAQAAHVDSPLKVVGNDTHSLARLPLEATGCSDELKTIFFQMGLQDLGNFLQLPCAEVARRLGDEAFMLWEAASGTRIRLLREEPPPRHFRISQELEYRVHTLEPLMFLLHRFLQQIEAQLRAATQYASHLELSLTLDHANTYQRNFKLPEPTQRAELLLRILHLHLEQLQTEEAIVGIQVEVTPVDPPHRQRGLFHTSLKDPWRFTDTQAQLVGLLGSESVGRPRLLDTHRPDSFVLEPVLDEIEPLTENEQERISQRTGPALRRCRPPIPVGVLQRNGQPVRLEGSLHRGAVQRAHGPFQLAGDWWQRDTAWSRTEWDIELIDGSALRLLHRHNSWFIEGIYD